LSSSIGAIQLYAKQHSDQKVYFKRKQLLQEKPLHQPMVAQISSLQNMK